MNTKSKIIGLNSTLVLLAAGLSSGAAAEFGFDSIVAGWGADTNLDGVFETTSTNTPFYVDRGLYGPGQRAIAFEFDLSMSPLTNVGTRVQGARLFAHSFGSTSSVTFNPELAAYPGNRTFEAADLTAGEYVTSMRPERRFLPGYMYIADDVAAQIHAFVTNGTTCAGFRMSVSHCFEGDACGSDYPVRFGAVLQVWYVIPPRITSLSFVLPDRVDAVLSFQSHVDHTYSIERSTDLSAWSDVQPPITGTGAVIQVTISGGGPGSSPSEQDAVFYRVRPY